MTDQVLQMAEDLATEFEPKVPKETVQRIVAETGAGQHGVAAATGSASTRG